MSFRRMRHVKAREVQGCKLALDASTPSMYDATSGGSLVAADGAIARWEDQSGNGNHVTQGTSGSRPTRKVSEANGYGSASFDGNSDTLLTAASDYSAFFGATTSTVIAVMKQASAKETNALLASNGGSSNGFLIWATYSDVIYYDSPPSTARVSVSQPSGWDDAYNVLAGKRDGGSELIRVNAKQLVSATGKTGSISYTSTALSVGFAPGIAGGVYYLQGHISILSVFPAALPSYVLARLEGAAMRKTRIKAA